MPKVRNPFVQPENCGTERRSMKTGVRAGLERIRPPVIVEIGPIIVEISPVIPVGK